MKTIETKVYTFDELSDKAKEAARQWYIEWYDDPMMQSHLGNLLKEKLEGLNIKYDTDSINVMYSLGYSQGDGLMFEGTLYDDRGSAIIIKHSGHYYHSNSRDIDYEGASEREYADFVKTYAAICKKIERAGYDEIEYQQSMEAVAEACEANDYTFTEAGKRFG
jgi:hypothetical protein